MDDDFKPRPNLDAAGIFWVSWCAVWTLLVCAGMGFLWYRRDTPLLKIRGLSLSFAAIAFLHTYWMVVQMAYIANPFPQQAEYWIMGIYLPFGIALFHASNTRFLYIARQQRRRFVRKSHQHGQSTSMAVFSRLGRLSHTRKMLVVIGTGMVLQVMHHPERTTTGAWANITQLILTVIMYLLSRKFHPSFGVPGTEVGGSPWDVHHQQGRGWEWYVLARVKRLWTWPAVLTLPPGGPRSSGNSSGRG